MNKEVGILLPKKANTSGVGKLIIASEASLMYELAGAILWYIYIYIIELVDSISKDERGFPLTQYITNGRISRGGYTSTHFKHHHRVLRLISYSMSV